MMTCKSGCKFSINTECVLAEREGFEPPEPFSSTVFKTAVIDHSTTSPVLSSLQKYFLKGSAKIVKILFRPKV